jgi:putative transposase
VQIQVVTDRDTYTVMRDHGLLHKPRVRAAELYQAARLFELLPQQPNELWQMDVTDIHIPGHGWWYAVTVIDYYSRYLLGCHLTSSYSALEVLNALKLAREEAERISGPLPKRPFLVTDNGSLFIARRFVDFVCDRYSHARIQYRTPQHCWGGFTEPLKPRRCTGGCTTILNMLAIVWRSSRFDTIRCDPIGPCCPN